MNSIVYLGLEPSDHQVVSADLLDKGIKLCRASPSEMTLVGVRDYDHPSYNKYVDNYAIALYGAMHSRVMVGSEKKFFFDFDFTEVPKTFQRPNVIWNYGESKTEEAMNSLKSKFGAIETTSSGKPALGGVLSRKMVKDLITETGPLETTSPSISYMNIRGFKVYSKLWSMFFAFTKLHQYALTPEGSSAVSDSTARFMRLGEKAVVKLLDDAGKETGMHVIKDQKETQFWMNLPTPFAAHEGYIHSDNDIPNDSGLLFPYELGLARDDHHTIPKVLESYFFNILGGTAIEAQMMLHFLCEGWKELKMTRWGHELAHAFTGIRLAFETGAGIRVLVGPTGHYGGFFLTGGCFQVLCGNKLRHSQTFATLQSEFANTSQHSSALTSLFSMLTFPSDIERASAMSGCTSMTQVSRVIRTQGYNINDRERMAKYLTYIQFPADVFLSANATNVARVLKVIASGIGEESLPMHHLAALDTVLAHRCLSAFGAGIPSFIFEGGRRMELSGQFSFKQKTKIRGKPVEVLVNTMYACIKPYKQACDDFDRVLSEKAVYTLAGTSRGGNASTKSLQREYDGIHGTEILSALRSVAKVVVSADATSANEKKRKAEEQAVSAVTKKVKGAMDRF